MTQSTTTPTTKEAGLQQMPATWDGVAPTYAEDAEQWSEYANECLRRMPLHKSDRVLDIATGPGTLALKAATQAARVDAVDFSPGMIDELCKKAARTGIGNVEAAVMDAQALGFADGTFDAAFCLFGFFFFPDRAKAFREMARVLKPGGRALIATWAPIERRPIMKLGFDAMAEAMPQMPRPGKGDLQSTEECVREMSEAGFRDVRSEPFTSSGHFASAEAYLETVVRSAAPLVAMKKKIGEQAWGQAKGRILEALHRTFPAGGADLSAEAILTHGVR